jgi:hypothetical protein
MPLSNSVGLKMTKEERNLVFQIDSATPPITPKSYAAVSLPSNTITTPRPLLSDAANAPPAQKLKLAMFNVHQETGVDIYEHFVRMAYAHPAVLISLMNKVLPNKQSWTLEPNDVEEFKTKFLEIFARHVKDPHQLEAIALDLSKLTCTQSLVGH